RPCVTISATNECKDRNSAVMNKTIPIDQYLIFFSSRRRHTRSKRDWSSDVCFPISNPSARVDRASARAFREVLPPPPRQARQLRSEERRVGKSVDLGGRRISIKKKRKNGSRWNAKRKKY